MPRNCKVLTWALQHNFPVYCSQLSSLNVQWLAALSRDLIDSLKLSSNLWNLGIMQNLNCPNARLLFDSQLYEHRARCRAISHLRAHWSVSVMGPWYNANRAAHPLKQEVTMRPSMVAGACAWATEYSHRLMTAEAYPLHFITGNEIWSGKVSMLTENVVILTQTHELVENSGTA